MKDKIKILLAEDEKMLAEILSDTLSDREFEVHLAYDGLQALDMAGKETFDVIVSDIMMPDLDGFSLARRLRDTGLKTPILFLTARSATEDIVKGFESGGNDFLRKPFAMDELIVRIKALAGRAEVMQTTETTYRIGRYRFNPSSKSLTLDGKETILAAREAAVLVRLCRRKGQVVEASDLLKELWGDDNYFNLRSLNVYITRLRHHLEGDPSVEIISIRSVGYKLSDVQII